MLCVKVSPLLCIDDLSSGTFGEGSPTGFQFDILSVKWYVPDLAVSENSVLCALGKQSFQVGCRCS